MRNTIITLFMIAAISNEAAAQTACKSFYSAQHKKTIYTAFDTAAEVTGGQSAFIRQLNKCVVMGDKEEDVTSYSFRIILVISEKGKIMEAMIEGKDTDEYTDTQKSALQCATVMKWNPAKCKTTSVTSMLVIPINLHPEFR